MSMTNPLGASYASNMGVGVGSTAVDPTGGDDEGGLAGAAGVVSMTLHPDKYKVGLLYCYTHAHTCTLVYTCVHSCTIPLLHSYLYIPQTLSTSTIVHPPLTHPLPTHPLPTLPTTNTLSHLNRLIDATPSLPPTTRHKCSR